MEPGHLSVILIEEGQEVPRQVILINLRERTDDGAVDGDVARVGGVREVHKDIAGVHIGVEKVVLKNLGKERFHAPVGQDLKVGSRGPKGF